MIEDFPRNPYAPPEAPLELQAMETEGLRPIPFEDVDAVPAFWRRVGSMFQILFQHPYELVDRTHVTENLGAPLRFALLFSLPITAMMAAIGVLIGVLGGIAASQDKNAPPFAVFVGMGAFYTVVMPMMAIIGFFIGGLINHGCLWLWGGLRQGYGLRQSIRLHGYYLGFFLLFYLIPILNIFVLLAGPAFLGLALARLHHTDRWRGVCAAYTPLGCCCGAYIAFFAIAIAAGAFK